MDRERSSPETLANILPRLVARDSGNFEDEFKVLLSFVMKLLEAGIYRVPRSGLTGQAVLPRRAIDARDALLAASFKEHP
jgi:hypothetical protein